jgi:hypothetical protein
LRKFVIITPKVSSSARNESGWPLVSFQARSQTMSVEGSVSRIWRLRSMKPVR